MSTRRPEKRVAGVGCHGGSRRVAVSYPGNVDHQKLYDVQATERGQSQQRSVVGIEYPARSLDRWVRHDAAGFSIRAASRRRPLMFFRRFLSSFRCLPRSCDEPVDRYRVDLTPRQEPLSGETLIPSTSPGCSLVARGTAATDRKATAVGLHATNSTADNGR